MRFLTACGTFTLVLALVCPSPPVAAQTMDQNRRITNGEIVTWVEDTGQALKTCVAIGIIDVAPDKVYRAMTDFANYPKVFKALNTAKVLKNDGHEADVAYTMTPPWPFTERKLTMRTVMNPGARLIKYHVIGGNVTTYEGQMTAALWGNNRTRFTYRTRIDPGLVLPAAIITWGTQVSLPGVVKDVARYAKALP